MPLCVVHNQEMRAGSKPGNFYCTAFVGLGAAGANQKGYCSQVINAPKTRAQQAFAPVPAQAGPAGDPLAAAALTFAGSVFHGSQDADRAVELAKRAYEEMRGVA